MKDSHFGASWSVGELSLVDAAARVVANGRSGALIRVQARARVASEEQVRATWLTCLEVLPPGLTAKRTGWVDFHAVVDGEEDVLCRVGAALMRRLVQLTGTSPRWQIALVALRAGSIDRAFACDPAYDLDAHASCALAWVEPHAGDDWRAPQRYPTVRLVRFDDGGRCD